MNLINQLIVDPDMSVKETKRSFNHLFPFLSLEFYRKGEVLETSYELKQLQELGGKKRLESVVIYPDMTVEELEKAFLDCLGLHVSVFRKVGNSILQTSFTSKWTLQHQNTKGSELLSAFDSKQ